MPPFDRQIGQYGCLKQIRVTTVISRVFWGFYSLIRRASICYNAVLKGAVYICSKIDYEQVFSFDSFWISDGLL